MRASYCQYDTYPDGLGASMLHSARRIAKLSEPEFADYKQRWREVVLVDEGTKPSAADIEILTAKGFTPSNVSSGDDWYAWLRENQGVLEAYLDTGYMLDSKSFGFDSLFCEWAWLIDLDARTFECYGGFQKEPQTAGRWAGGGSPETGYYGVKLLRTYSIDDLPLTDEGFIAEINALAGRGDDEED